MIGLSITFDLGRYHATPWGSNVNDGEVEWPPSAWRVLRALYAVSRTNTQLHGRREHIDRALRTLAAAPPPLFKLPPSSTAHTRHYVPSRNYSPTKQGETDRVLDAFRAFAHDAKLELWWRAKLDEDAHAGLAATAAALGYLGRSESVCSAALLDDDSAEQTPDPADFDALPADEAERDGDIESRFELVELLCVGETDDPLVTLTASVGELRRQRTLRPPGTRSVAYARRALPASPEPRREATERPTLARFRVIGRGGPSLYEAVSAGEALRSALQSIYGSRNGKGASRVFSGRDGERPRADQHVHAHYLATPGKDGRRIEHLTVWAPEGFDAAEVASLAILGKVTHRTFAEPLLVVLAAIGRPEQMAISDFLDPATQWRSLTPFALPRHPKRRGGRIVETPEDQIRREWKLRHPELEDTLLGIELLAPGRWQEFKRTRATASRLAAPRVVGARLRFSEPIRGPLALGALSHYGLGLFVPERPG